MPNFTTEEREIIKGQTLPDEELPKYYSKTSMIEVPISREFENYLILQNQTQKQKALDWINKATEIEADNAARDEILTTYFEIRKTDADDRVTELDEKLENYNTFVTSLFSPQAEEGTDPVTKFGVIPDLTIFVQSLEAPLSKITMQRGLAFHEQNLIKLLEARLGEEITDADSTKELESWQTVISTYDGVPG